MPRKAQPQKQEGKAPTERELRAALAEQEAGYKAYIAEREKGTPRAENKHADAYSAYKRAYTALLAKGKGAKGKKRTMTRRQPEGV